MYVNISQPQHRTQRTMLNMVNDQYRGEGFSLPYFDYQKSLFSRNLWTSKRSLLRIIPGNDGRHTFPQNINTESYDEENPMTHLSDTFYYTSTVSNFGDSGLEFCCGLQPGSNESTLYPSSPIEYFCSTIHWAVTKEINGKKTKYKIIPEWRNWCGLKGTLPFARPTLMFQAVCYELNGRVCQKGGDSAEEAPLYCLVGINSNVSIQELVKALTEPMDPTKPVGPNNNKFGSLAEASGSMLYMHPATTMNGNKQIKYLKPGLSEVPGKWDKSPCDLPEDYCMAIWQPWDKLIKYLTCEEQVRLLAKEFGSDTVNYIFGQDHQWDTLPIPDEIKAEGLGRYGSGAAPVQRPPTNMPPTAPATESPKMPFTPPPRPGMSIPSIADRLAAIRKSAGKAPDPAEMASAMLN